MAFSAAELQKRHGLEGAPDPFPTLGNNTPAPKSTSTAPKANGSGSSAPAPVDASSEDAFPSLGPSAGAATNIAKPAISAWSSKPSAVKTSKGKITPAGGLGRTGAPTSTSHPFSDTFAVPIRDIETGKAYQEILKKVQESTGASVESSTQMSSGLRTFLIRAADQKRLAYARKLLERGLSKSVTIQVEVPISTLGTIIGPKGATLKSITDSTQCKIDIPRRDTLPTWDPKEVEEDEEDGPEEPSVPISVSGPSVACNDARTKILGLISHKVSQTTQSIKTIPSSYYPFIAGPKGVKARQLEEEIGQGEVKVHIPPPAVWKALERQGEEEVSEKDLSIKVRGDKEKVKAVVDHILQQFEQLNDSFRELKISIPKRQHRFLVGAAADQILEETGCIVELPPVEDPSDQCAIRGPQPGLVPALTMAMDKANAIAVEMVDVVALHRTNTSDSLSHAKRILRFLTRSSRLRSIADAHGVKVYPPFASTVSATGNVVIEVVGEDRAKVSKAKEEVAQVVKSILPAGVAVVEIDSLVHSILIGKKGAKIAQFESANNVTTVFPPVSEDSSEVLIIFTGEGLPADKKARDAQLSKALSAASAELESLAKEASNIKTETLEIEKKWHRFIIGQNGTVLNALIGEDQLVNVKVGSKDKKSNGEDDNSVVIRGQPSEVDRVVSQINSIVEDAKNDDIVNGYTLEFSVDRKHVPHLVGSSGAAINKLRETLGVKINFDDDDKKGGKRAPCKIVGRKEAVEEAKRRLEAQVEKLEDETTESVTIKRAIQPALIGSGGKYAIRLEEKYGVKLSFPRDNKDGSSTAKPDEVTIRGGKKGVAQAKAELLEAAAFENESRQELKFSVPSKSVAQIVGKSGSTINGIKDETGAQIDIDKAHGDDGKTSITVRGSKDAIAAAKKAVLAVVEEVGDEINVSLTIDPKYHRTLIGQGGSNLRELVVNAGGPEESFKQAGLITFPREGRDTAPDEVRLRGDSKLVNKIKAELEKQVEVLKQTIIVGVVVPQAQHASKIGRGGSALQDLQRKTGATVHFPGSRQYGSIGKIENASELEGAEAGDIVKVIGTKEVVAKATELLQVSSERPQQQNRGGGRDTPDWTTRTVSIPTKYYHAVADYPNLMRSIRNVGGQVQLPQPAPPKPKATQSSNGNSSAAQAARIDFDGGDNQEAEEVTGNWEVIQNYQDGDDSEQEWTVKGKEENLDKLVSILESAVEKAKSATHVGLLTGLPRSTFPRIIGSKGATISRLRVETGADIQVGKDDDLITIIGDESSINQGKEAILSIVNRSGGARY